MKPEYIGIGNFDEDNYVYGFCQCPLSTDYAIKWPRIKDGKPHIYTCTCENCGTEVGVVSKSYGPEVGTDKTYGEWIPVSEKLPEENKTVIASTKYGVYPETRYTKNGWEWAYEAGADYWRELEDVTAWMPLPEKPYEVNYSIKTVTNAKEAEEYQIKED